ncbi:MAG: polyprenol phosphomannose-dependent alpha 1,6 mannosyltransferase MptB [Actinomycetota bacterium]|nr:polyprenol phosphomannose-dependent alpha 1,6 mannosyltransferase MptB [Actinomycetota bacterium]
MTDPAATATDAATLAPPNGLARPTPTPDAGLPSTARQPIPAEQPTWPPGPTQPEPSGLFGGARAKPLLLGLLGSLLIATAGVGAGGKLVRDTILEGTPLIAIRFGHGYDLAVLVVYLGLVLELWAWVLLGRDVLARRAGDRAVLCTALAWIAPMVVSPPLFTRDPFSYLAYGTMPLRGLDPYGGGPSGLTGPIAHNVHWFWTDTPAPYGPLFILVAKGVAAVTGEHMIAGVILMRLAMLPGLALFVIALPGLVRHLGGRLPVALWLAVANPVMVLHLIGGPHNDLLLVGLLASGCLLVLNRRHAAGIALATLAMAVKATAGFALPFLVLVWAARLTGSERSRILRAGAAGVSVFLVVFTGVSVAAGVGLGWLPALNAPSNIVNWLSLPTGVGELLHGVVNVFASGLSATPFFTVTRIIGILVFFAIAAKQWLAARGGGPDAVRRAGVVLLLFALLSPATLPWYYAWGLTLLAATAWTARQMSVVIFVSIFLMVSAFPSGEVALYAWGYLVLMMIGAAVAAYSLISPDPLRLRAPREWTHQAVQ